MAAGLLRLRRRARLARRVRVQLWLACALLICGGIASAQTQTDPEASEGPLRQVREIVAAHAMVVSANPLATQAGIDLLRAGGNAIDAAAATALALNVVEPQSSGIGGGSFALVALKGEERVTAWDGREEAPAAVTPDWFLRPDGTPQPFYPDRITGGRPVGVPGLVKLLDGLLAKYGKMGWSAAVRPAIRLAEEGFPVSPRLAKALAIHAKRLAQFPATRAQFLHPDGSPLVAGDLLRQPDLGKALRRLGDLGARGFYEGPVSAAILKAVNEAPLNPGHMTAGDLTDYDAVQRAPVALPYRTYTVYGMGPPTSGGVTVLQTLALLDRRPEASGPRTAALTVHEFTLATRVAFADRDKFLADPDFVPVPLRGLLDPAYLQQRARSIPWNAPLAPVAAGLPPGLAAQPGFGEGEDSEYVSTSHLTAVDADRNAISMTSSVEQAFGSAMVVPGWGFLLNNELTDFNARPLDDAGQPVANRPEGGKRPRITALDGSAKRGGKRPRSSMAPTLVFEQGRLVYTLGSPGGPLIIPYVALTLTRVLDAGMPLQEAIDAPLTAHIRGVTLLEPEWSPEVRGALEQLGHRVVIARLASGLHGIRIAADGSLHSGVDPRREGSAAGY